MEETATEEEAPTEETAAVEATQEAEVAEGTAGGETGEDDEDIPASSGDGERGRRVYVGNLAWEVSWQDLKDHMKSTGLEPVRSNIMQMPDGRSKGCGIVEFSTPEGAEQAVLTLNDTELYGRQIFVREDRRQPPPQ
jgi:RNA recognition motif-containing protein